MAMPNPQSRRMLKRILLAASLVVTGWALLTLRWQSDLLDIFPSQMPEIRDLRNLQARGGQSFVLLGVVTNTGGESTAQLTERLNQAARTLAKTPLVANVEVLPDPAGLAPAAWAAVFIGLPTDKFAQLTRATSELDIRARLQQARADLSGWPDPALWAKIHYDPLGFANLIIAPRAAGVAAKIPAPPNPILRVTPSVPTSTLPTATPVVAAVRSALAEAGFAPGTVALTGQAAYVVEIGTQMRREMMEMTVSSAVLIALAFLLAYRSWFPLIALLTLQGAGLLAGVLVARLVWGSVNVFSVAFCSVALGLCSDYGVVVYHHLSQGGDCASATWRRLRRSMIYCVLTTVVGLGALAASALPGLRQFAVLVTACLVVVSVLALGPWARWVRIHIKPQTSAPVPETERPPPGWLRLAGWAYLTAGWLLLAWSLLHFDRLYDFSWARLLPAGLEAQRGQDVLDGYLPAKLIAGDETAWAANRRAWATHTDVALAPIFEAEGFKPELARPYEFLFHALDQWIKGDDTLEIWARGSTAYSRLQSALPDLMKSNLTQVLMWSVAAILVLLVAGMGSVTLVLRTLLALAAGVGWWLAGLAALHEPLSLVAFGCLPILFGLSEDFCIFLILFVRQEGQRWPLAVRRLGTPLALCTLITVIGFGTTGFSTQPALRNFGLVLALGILSSFMAALLGLPTLLAGVRADAQGHTGRMYTSFWFGLAALGARVVPRILAQWLAAGTGRIYAAMHPRWSQMVLENLRCLTGQRLPASAARTVCANFSRNLADYFYLGTRPRGERASLFPENHGLEHLVAARAGGHGALLLTCHYGFFEGAGTVLQQSNFPLISLTAPEPSSSLTAWRAQFRSRLGMETLALEPDPFFPLRIVEKLRENCFVAALIDRPIGSFVEVRVPGGVLRVAGNIILVAQLARAPVIPVLVSRRPDGRYRTWASAPIYIEDQGSRTTTAQHYAQRIMDCLLPELSRDCAQWTQFVPLSKPTF